MAEPVETENQQSPYPDGMDDPLERFAWDVALLMAFDLAGPDLKDVIMVQREVYAHTLRPIEGVSEDDMRRAKAEADKLR